MDDLVAFVEARLAEDQERAERGQWTAEFLSQGGRKDPGSKRAYAKDIEREGGYSPARVLREVKAKRKILALHRHLRFAQPLNANSKFEEDHRPAFDEAPRYVGCERCSYDSRFEEVYPNWWCDHVRLLALPYADHPDFRPEWSPTDA